MTFERLAATLSQQGADVVLPPLRHGQRPGTARLVDAVSLPVGVLILVELADGGRVLAPMVDGESGWRRAVPGDGVSARLLLAQEPLLVNGFGAELVAFEGPEQSLTVDQTNDSVVVGEQVLVKWQVAVSDAPAVAPLILAHLRAVGFAATTPCLATVSWGDLLVAQVLEYLPGAQDGWDWMVDELVAALVRGDELSMAWPGEVGRLLGSFHSAMATPSASLPEPVVSVADLAPLQTYFAGLLVASERLDAEMRAALEPWRPRLAAALAVVGAAHAVPALRIHGDAHVGQVLRWRGGLVLGDFDGNPLLAPAHRADPGPTAYDVASMLRALDHVALVAARRVAGGEPGGWEEPGAAPGVSGPLRAWSTGARASFLAAYREAGPVELLDDQLLAAFADLSVLHEAVYAATYLPRWRHVPLAVLAGGPPL